MKLFTAALGPLLFCSTIVSQGRVVTATEANGTYRYRNNEIKILALGNHKLRVQLDLTYEYKSSYGLMANIGQASGEASIQNDIAIFTPPGMDGCKITLKFLAGGKLMVKQEEGDDAACGFGHNVYADGTYRKIRGGKPKFETASER
jgi:hypothetical protein